MAQRLQFDPIELPPECEKLRAEVREFIAAELGSGSEGREWSGEEGWSPDFSRKLGERGWLGMMWPKKYGGHERTALERYVMTEEMLAAGAPVSAHWVADRQSGPLLLRFGSEEQRNDIVPRITRGECFFSIGMSEPDSGSDLASVRTTATKTDDGYLVNGAKLWTSGAHHTHYMIALVRTSPLGEDRHRGLSQLIIDLTLPGITIRPIYNLAGQHQFNEVVMADCLVPENMMIGDEGNGWAQVMSELGYERSGPERFLSTFNLFRELVRAVGPKPERHAAEAIGRLTAHLMTLRQMSLSVAGMLQAGQTVNVEAALVKDRGTAFEREIPEIARLLAPTEPTTGNGAYSEALASAIFLAPSVTIRGGTREILRVVIARGLGLT